MAKRKTYKGKIGLGDVIENITKATGIKKVVEFIAGEDCGCDKRKALLNSIQLPTRFKALRCMTEQMKNDYGDYIKVRTLNYKPEHVKLMIDIYAHVFARQYNQRDLCINCQGSYNIIKAIEDKLDIVYNSYDK